MKGILARIAPHISQSQSVGSWEKCQRLWWEVYGLGKKVTSPRMEIGNHAHWAVAELLRGLALKPDEGLAMEDVDPVLDRLARKVRGFSGFVKLSEGLRRYAERANELLAGGRIVAVEDRMYSEQGRDVGRMDLTAPLAANYGKGKHWEGSVTGRPDLLYLSAQGDLVIKEHKTLGRVPSPEELEQDHQTSTYNALIRKSRDLLALLRKRGWTGVILKVWESLMHGICTHPVIADERDAEAAWRYYKGAIPAMLEAAESGKFEETPGEHCLDCPYRAKCAGWKQEREAVGSEQMVPTLDIYARLGSRLSALGELREKAADIIGARVAEAGGVLVENGFRAEMRSYPAKLKEEYLLMTKDQLLDELRTSARTTLLVRRGHR